MAQSPENNHDPVLSVDCQALLDENRILKDEIRILKDEIRALNDEIRALNDEVQKLRARLEEPEELQRAISEGDLDALVMPVSEKDLMVFTLNCTDQVYHIMMEKANEDVVIVDAEFKITNVGKRLFNKTGYSQEEVIGRSWLDFVDEASKAVAELHMEKRRQGIDGSYEAKLIRKDGSPYWAIISVKPLFDNDGNFKGTLSMLTDITDRKQAEEALRESEMRYRMLFDKSMDAIILTDPRGVGIVLSANPAACKMLGWTLEELILKGLDEIFDVKNPALSTLLDEHIPSGSAKSQVNYRHKDGTTLTGEVSSTFFIDRNGEPRAVTIMRDITGRKQAEKALQKSEAKYRNIVETAYEGIWVIDAEFRTTYANMRLAEMFGYSLEEMFDRQGMYFTDDEGKAIAKQKMEMRRQGISETHEFKFMRKDGSPLWLLASSKSLYDKCGKFMGSLGMFTDISERKKSEEMLKLKMEELERSNSELEQFAYVSSHDLQEPLRMISSYLQLLQRRYQGKIDEKADKYIYYAADGAARMQVLINDLLEFSRVTTKAEKPELTDSELVLNQVLSNLDLYIKQNKATISHNPLPEVMADNTQLTQVFQNLIANGMKFHGEEAPKIHISAEKKRANGYFQCRIMESGLTLSIPRKSLRSLKGCIKRKNIQELV